MTNIKKLRTASEESVARMLAKVYIEGMLQGTAMVTCEEGETPEEITREDVDEIFKEHGDILTANFLELLHMEDEE